MKFLIAVLLLLSQNLYFDFGEGVSVEEGWTTVDGATIYTKSLGYGWTDIIRDETRPELEGIYRGLVWSGAPSVFYVDLPNGNYRVTVYYGDMYPHELTLYAEGAFIANLTSYVNKPTAHVFITTVDDGQLALSFDDGGTGAKWTLSALEIEGLPPEEPTPNATETVAVTELGTVTETERTTTRTTVTTTGGGVVGVSDKIFGMDAVLLVGILALIVVTLGIALFLLSGRLEAEGQ